MVQCVVQRRKEIGKGRQTHQGSTSPRAETKKAVQENKGMRRESLERRHFAQAKSGRVLHSIQHREKKPVLGRGKGGGYKRNMRIATVG